MGVTSSSDAASSGDGSSISGRNLFSKEQNGDSAKSSPSSRPNRRSAPTRAFDSVLPSGTALIIDPRCLLHVTNMPKFERPVRLWGCVRLPVLAFPSPTVNSHPLPPLINSKESTPASEKPVYSKTAQCSSQSLRASRSFSLFTVNRISCACAPLEMRPCRSRRQQRF